MEHEQFPEKRIVLWSHPRSVSTAFELVFEEREDTTILHEPCARLRHRKFLQQHCPDPETKTREGAKAKVFRQLLGPQERAILFVKDMAYYLRGRYYDALLPHLLNTFIIRNPEESLVSHYKKSPRFTFEQAGYAALEALHEYVNNTLKQPSIIVDGNDFRSHPVSVMRQYCAAVGIAFDRRTLQWEPGKVKGWEIWEHQGWHKEAERSAGVLPPPAKPPDISGLSRRVLYMLPECRRIYEKLFAIRIRPEHDKLFGVDDEGAA
jgi:hypothetical protein